MVYPYRSEEHTSELQSRELISYAVFCLKKKKVLIELGAAVARVQGLLVIEAMKIFYFFTAPPTTNIYTSSHTLSLHDALPIYNCRATRARQPRWRRSASRRRSQHRDRKSTRLNSSHVSLSRMPSSA